MENDLAFFQISGKSDLVYFAQNAKGESLFLETLQAEIPKVVYDAIGKDGKLSAKKKQEFLDKFDTMPNENQPMMSYIKALGSVSQLIVVKPMKFVSKEVPVKVLKTPDFKAKIFTVNRERYENLPANFHYDKITDADLANLSVKIRRSNDGLNNHVVLVSVPNSFNSASARVEFKDVLAKKGGKNVEFEGQGAFYEEKEKNFSYRLEPKSGDKPIEVDEIKGTISITFPAEITTMNLPANKKSEDFELISPSRVRFFRKESDLDNSSSVKPIRAYAANGMALKRMEGISSSGSENSKSYVEYMFWGKVAAVQVDVATKWLTKEIPFSVKPAAKTEKKF